MKFTLSINMERTSPAVDMREVARHTLEMAQMAEEGGFDIVWVGEHTPSSPRSRRHRSSSLPILPRTLPPSGSAPPASSPPIGTLSSSPARRQC